MRLRQLSVAAVLLLPACGATTGATADATDVKAAQGCHIAATVTQLVKAGDEKAPAEEVKLGPIEQTAQLRSRRQALVTAFAALATADSNGDQTAFVNQAHAIGVECAKLADAATAAGGFSAAEETGLNKFTLGSASPSPVSSPTPVAPAPAALEVHITSSTYGHVAATTKAEAVCTAAAVLPSGRTSTAAGLQVSMTAGANGVVAWDYRTTGNTGKGTGTHTVTCQLNGKVASGSADFTV
jgi:hypothetical protein